MSASNPNLNNGGGGEDEGFFPEVDALSVLLSDDEHRAGAFR
jgi:hypothetical protein